MNSADANTPLRIFGEAIFRSFYRSVFGLRVTGLDNVPNAGPLIVACNHVSVFDPPLAGVAISAVRRPFVLGKKELVDSPVLGPFCRMTGAISLDRSGDVSAMREALDVLGRGGSLMIFPEGTRQVGGQRRPPKAGVAFLSARSGASVLPIHVVGTQTWSLRSGFEARIGRPIAAAQRADRENGLAYAQAVMDAVYSL